MQTRARKRLTLFVFFIMVVGALVVALWQYHQMVVAVYDGASASVYRRMLRPFSGPPDMIGQRPIRIALLQTPRSGSEPAEGDGLVRQWQHVLTQQGFGVRRIETLESLEDLSEFNLVIIPGAIGLGNAELALIKAFVAEGNGVIMSWAAGTRSPTGEWQGDQFLRHVAGIELDMTPRESDDDRHMRIALSVPSSLATGIEPGFVLAVTKFDQPLTARVLEPRVQVAGVVQADFEAGAQPVRPPSFPVDHQERAMMVYGDYLAGRFAWMGFTIASSATAPEQQSAFLNVIRNAVVWTTRQPMTVKPHWPESVDSAFSLAWRITRAEDVDDRLPALARAYRIPLTAYVTPDLLRDDEELMRTLASYGPVGVMLLDEASGEAGSPPSLSTLQSWRRRLGTLNPGSPVGCLIGVGAVDEWLDRLVEAGFDYVARSDTAHGLPRILREHRRVPVLMRPHELWELPDTLVREASTESLLRWFDSSHAAGNLLHLSLPPGPVSESTLDALDRLFTRIRRRRVWTATAPEVLAFYRVWGHLRIASEYPTPNRYVVQVSNTGTRAAEDFNVMIRLASPHRTLEITPTTLGTPPVHAVSDDGITWRFDIPRIPAGKNYIYHVYRQL